MASRESDALFRDVVAIQEDPAALIALLEARLPPLRDDSLYWQVLLAAWVKHGRIALQERYRALLSSPRRNRYRGMKKADRRAWRALPPVVHAIRAIAPGEDPDLALSWSLDSAAISRIYPDRKIIERDLPKSRIIFFTRRRGEAELVVL